MYLERCLNRSNLGIVSAEYWSRDVEVHMTVTPSNQSKNTGSSKGYWKTAAVTGIPAAGLALLFGGPLLAAVFLGAVAGHSSGAVRQLLTNKD